MNKLVMLLVVAAATAATLAATSCGDNNKVPDARVADSSGPDAYCSNCPAPPALGVQMDRMGRPAVNTALYHAFDPAGGNAKDAYNADGSKGGWVSNYAASFAGGLAVLDVLDTGLTCADGTCSCEVTNCAASVPTTSDGCGDQVLYNGAAGGSGSATANAASYTSLAGILADDELYLDTTKASCNLASHQNYLAVEFNVVTGSPNTTCGGRAPLNDVIDTSYTALAIGINGFKLSDGSYTPFFGDGVGPHADVNNDTFPFLGAPH